MSVKVGEQHAWLHQQWPPPYCCLCNHEALLTTQATQIAALEAEVGRLKAELEQPFDAEHIITAVAVAVGPASARGVRHYIEQAKTDLAPFVALAKAMTPDQAWLLADWIDTKYPGDVKPEVQRSLRALGEALAHPSVQRAVA